MSHAPNDAVADLSQPEVAAFREANSRQQELLRNGVSNSGHERNCCFLNTGQARFANISSAAGMDHIGDGRAYALTDWDLDGDLDVWATNRTEPRVQYLRNNVSRENHFVGIKLQGNGTSTNRDAIGARVEVILKDSTDGRLIKTLRAGEGFMSQSSKALHFGLGKHSEIDRVRVQWPGGEAEEFADLQADHHYRLVQGSGTATRWSRSRAMAQLESSDDPLAKKTEQTRIPLRYRVPLPSLQYETMTGAKVTLAASPGKPTLVNLWASWCRPCLKELVEFKRQEKVLANAGLNVVALSVDELAEDRASDATAARGFAERQKFSFHVGFATNDLVGKLEATLYYLFDYRRPWAVPTSLLLDDKGQLAVIYVGAIDVETVLQDAARLSLSDAEWAATTQPFPGQWIDSSRHPNLVSLISTYSDQGFEPDALDMVDRFASVLEGDPAASSLLVKLALKQTKAGEITVAQKRLRQAVSANATDVSARFQLARLLAVTKQFSEAIRHAEKAVQLRPEFADAHFLLANLLNTQKKSKAALSHFETVVQLQPELAKARMSLGLAYATEFQWNQAVTQLRRATELEPENSEYHYQLARVQQKLGQDRQAIASFRRALELRPNSADIHYSLGAAYSAQHSSKQALYHLGSAYRLNPDSLLVMNGFAWLLATEEDISKEDRLLGLKLAKSAAQKTGNKHPQVLDTLAAALAATGDFDRAVQTVQKALKIAEQAQSKQLAGELRKRLKSYQQRQPYRTSH